MAQSNYNALSLHMIAEFLVEEKYTKGPPGPLVGDHFMSTPRYIDIMIFLQHL